MAIRSRKNTINNLPIKSRSTILCLIGSIILSSLAIWYGHLHFLLWIVERDINHVYRDYRPFPYRWTGAPYSPFSQNARVVSRDLLADDLAALEKLTTKPINKAHILQLKGRIHLLSGEYELAIQD